MNARWQIWKWYWRTPAKGCRTGAITKASAVAATAAALAAITTLGSQVYQFDTRAQALAATIPASVKNIIITREDAGYPLSNAPCVQGTSSGPRAFLNNGVYWELDLSGGINLFWFGTGGTDDHDAIMAAQAAMVATKKTLFWFPGSYTISQSLNLSNANTRHVNFGGVTINFTGTGPAIIFDGGATMGALYDVTFGSREFPFKVVGNPNCTTLAFAAPRISVTSTSSGVTALMRPLKCCLPSIQNSISSVRLTMAAQCRRCLPPH
jgi:hypothetical protein